MRNFFISFNKVNGRHIILIFCLLANVGVYSQVKDKENSIVQLIDQYNLARDKKDTVLLKQILTEDVDQLVSNGEWRIGIATAMQGMLRSSETNTGTRTLTVDKVRFLDVNNAIADCRYEIQNSDGSVRKMWSSFIVVRRKGKWLIAGIRNMLPAPQR